jgi:hypothetical protein
MWLTGTSLERIDSALGRGETADVDRLLAEILAGASSTEPTPTVCYESAVEIFRGRQERFLRGLDAVTVPAHLRPIRERNRTSAERQIGFHRDFTDARMHNPAALPNPLGHRDLRESDYDLHRAWDLVRQTYPIFDPRLAEATEHRLGHLDII